MRTLKQKTIATTIMMTILPVMSCCWPTQVTAAKYGSRRHGSASFSKSIRDTVSRAVVRVIDETDHEFGTGTLVGKSGLAEYFVLTAHHCVEDLTNDFSVEHYPFGPRDRTRQVTVISYDEERDLALLRARIYDNLPTLRIAAESEIPKQGSVQVLVAGFPSGRLTLAASTAHKHDFRGYCNWRFETDFGAGISGAPVIARLSADDFALIGCMWGAARFADWDGMANAEVATFVADTGKYAYLLKQPNDKQPVLVAALPPATKNPAQPPRIVVPNRPAEDCGDDDFDANSVNPLRPPGARQVIVAFGLRHLVTSGHFGSIEVRLPAPGARGQTVIVNGGAMYQSVAVSGRVRIETSNGAGLQVYIGD